MILCDMKLTTISIAGDAVKKIDNDVGWGWVDPKYIYCGDISSDINVTTRVLGGLLWLVHREPGKCDTSLLPLVPLPFAAEDIQMSAQDPSFNQAPVNVLRVCMRGTGK